MEKMLALAAAAAAFCGGAAQAATPITYTNYQEIEGRTVSFALTTDGSLGSIGLANLLGWDITIGDGVTSANFYSAPSDPLTNSEVSMTATLFASASQLFLPYIEGSTNNEIGFRYPTSWQYYYSAGGGSTFQFAFGQYISFATGVAFAPASADILLGTAGSVGPGAVPEPGTWAMMLLGFGLTGVAMRAARRKRTVSVSYS